MLVQASHVSMRRAVLSEPPPAVVTRPFGFRRELLQELNQRVRRAVTLPVRIAVKDVYDETCTELLISAPLDSGATASPWYQL